MAQGLDNFALCSYQEQSGFYRFPYCWMDVFLLSVHFLREAKCNFVRSVSCLRTSTNVLFKNLKSALHYYSLHFFYILRL